MLRKVTSIRLKFLGILSITLFLSAVLISTVVAINEKNYLEHSLTAKGYSLASNIATRNENALIITGSTQLQTVLSELITDEEIVYTVIEDAKGKLLTTQFESINYKWPGLTDILAGLSKDRELPDIIAVIKKKIDLQELSVPITVGSDVFGKVTIGMSKNRINTQIFRTLLFVLVLNLAVAVLLGTVLFVSSKKILLDPIAELVNAVTRISKGDLSTHVAVTGSGEIKMLMDSFNAMANTLDKTTVSKDFMNDIFKSMTETLIVLTPDHLIREVNDAVVKLLGYDKSELVGQHIEKILDSETAALPTFASGAKSYAGSEIWLRSKDCRKVPVFFTVSLMTDVDGLTQGIVCVMHDISERKHAELVLTQKTQELERSNTELQQFAYIASHDLQEPLRKVTAFGDRLQDKYSDVLGEQGLDYLTRMQNAAHRMQTLINDLLTFSRVTSKAQPFESVNLDRIAQEVLSDLETKIEHTCAIVEVGKLPEIDADPLQMRQLFQNIIGNALKFQKSDVSPHITITCRSLCDDNAKTVMHELKFMDNGIGFNEKYTDRIFEVFQRLHGRNEYEGTGIGLAICRKIVERHSGCIIAKSTPDNGAEFIITFPVNQSKGESINGEAV